MVEIERAPPPDRIGELESWVRAEYERCHPQESFDDLKRRARFSKEDKGLLRQWLEAAARESAVVTARRMDKERSHVSSCVLPPMARRRA